MFAGRTALAAALALCCALALGLHEPHWAAWTVISVGLPARGDGLLKAFNRALGTAVGAPVGVLLIVAAHGSAPGLVGLLALWLAACVYAGVTLRSHRAYAAVLAGYTAVIVATSLVHGSGGLLDMARDRCAGIFTGIACALVLLLLSRHVPGGHASQRIRHAIATACDWAAARLAGLPRERTDDGRPLRLRGQFIEILSLDGAVHSAVAESPALWTRASCMHRLVTALVDLLVVSRSVERNVSAAACSFGGTSAAVDVTMAEASALLESVARTMRGEPADEIVKLRVLRRQAQALRTMLMSMQAASVIERRRIDLLAALLGATAAALTTYATLAGEPHAVEAVRYPPPVYTRDRRYACVAALRAACALLAAGALWIATGWQGGPLFVAFTGIAVSLFALRPDPRHTGIHFLASGALGAGAALLFSFWIAPHIAHATGVALAEGVVVFLAIVVAALLSNPFWASGFSLVFLVVSDPESISHASLTAVSQHALGVLAGAALAALAFHLAPSRARERLWRREQLAQVATSIRALIASPAAPLAAGASHAWQSMHIDALVRFALPAASDDDVDECMAWIEIGTEFVKLRDCVHADAFPPSARETIVRLFADLGRLEAQNWYARLVVAEATLVCANMAADQRVLSARATLLELALQLKHRHGEGLRRRIGELSGPGAR
ncbi:fusaric acid resistance protein [Caballeronia glathei]|uniref:Fusaric acid resistance protein n=2 Tax=Caballeronia glathei TaxID=60547 RepID=A0A069PUK9_9BURK|nr:fusaric acid resistance protein [Caballeronia glathei]